MVQIIYVIFWAFICSIFAAPYSAWANLVIHSKVEVEIELLCYEALAENSLFKGKLPSDGKQEIATTFQGLSLLAFTQGQTYPIIIGDETFTVQVSSPSEPPTFPASEENKSLYRALTDKIPIPQQYIFAALMIQAKNLLDSSHAIRTIAELQAKKKEFQKFVENNFHRLKHSDMIRRLIAQSFMMHEYVDYHVEGAPASDIKKRYQQEVLDGVSDWLKTLSPHLPKQEILNYCVSLYYKRSMITLASLIIDKFKDAAFCPGEVAENLVYPPALQILAANQNKTLNIADVKGKKIIAFVSEQCPVSMAAAVSKARKLAAGDQATSLIVAPQEKLSDRHLAMIKMIRNGNLLFMSDEKWRIENLAQKIRLPLFIEVKEDSSWEIIRE